MLTFTSNESVPFIDVLCDTWLNAEKKTRINYCRKTHYVVCVHIIQTVWGKKKRICENCGRTESSLIEVNYLLVFFFYFFAQVFSLFVLQKKCVKRLYAFSSAWSLYYLGFFHYSHINCPFVQTVNDENCCNFFLLEIFHFILYGLMFSIMIFHRLDHGL